MPVAVGRINKKKKRPRKKLMLRGLIEEEDTTQKDGEEQPVRSESKQETMMSRIETILKTILKLLRDKERYESKKGK